MRNRTLGVDVTPTNIITGATAPTMVINYDECGGNSAAAVKIAKEKSSLSRFKDWAFL